jgi:hypothetical protein
VSGYLYCVVCFLTGMGKYKEHETKKNKPFTPVKGYTVVENAVEEHGEWEDIRVQIYGVVRLYLYCVFCFLSQR